MMYSTINKPTQVDSEFIDSVITHAVNFLVLDELEIEIKFKKLGNVAANVYYDNSDQFVDMEVNKDLWRKKHEFERTIFHELVHVKQILEGRLDPTYPSKWNGIIYTCSYYDLPWEKEAYALEDKMFESFYLNKKSDPSRSFL